MQHTGSKTGKSVGVHASNNENSDSKDEDDPLQASEMKDRRYPAKPLQRNEMDLDATNKSNKDSEDEV